MSLYWYDLILQIGRHVSLNFRSNSTLAFGKFLNISLASYSTAKRSFPTTDAMFVVNWVTVYDLMTVSKKLDVVFSKYLDS